VGEGLRVSHGRQQWQNTTVEFVAQGYETTNNCEIEAGFEKVAIYVDLV